LARVEKGREIFTAIKEIYWMSSPCESVDLDGDGGCGQDMCWTAPGAGPGHGSDEVRGGAAGAGPSS